MGKSSPRIRIVVEPELTGGRLECGYIPTTKKRQPPSLFNIFIYMRAKEIILVKGKKMSEISDNVETFNKIKKYKLFTNDEFKIINDLPTYNRFDNFEDFEEYLTVCNYENFNELCKYEHPHRLMKRWGLPITLIHEMFAQI